VPTRNSAEFLDVCLASLASQTYPHTELIVVDRDSTDATVSIAKKYGAKVYNHGPERSWQRNYGADKAAGTYLLMIDSDMSLEPEVVAQCVAAMDDSTQGVIIPEQSYGTGFWAQCKALERSYYVGNDTIEAPRFMRRETFLQIGAYDTDLVSGEDWELGQRLRKRGSITRIAAYIHHNEGHLSFRRTIYKKYYYARLARGYLQASGTTNTLTDDAGPLRRFMLFLSRPSTLLSRPHYGLGMLFMKFCEYAAGGVGYYLIPNWSTQK
jgi:glycosyltransferase involved in cell wall biosynthesis